MFASTHQASLRSCQWRDKRVSSVQFVEAWQYEGATEASDQNFRQGTLNGDAILRWIRETHPHRLSHGTVKTEPRKLIGHIRLVICERSQYNPLDFPISRDVFEEIEAKFHLHPSTLTAFESDVGVHSRYLTYSTQSPPKLDRIACVIKAPQKREISNCGLSLSHEIDTGATTALLYGTDTRMIHCDPKHGATLKVVYNFINVLRDSIAMWNHPVLLPSLFLHEHMDSTTRFCAFGTPMREVVLIEQELGVTKVGQNAYLISSADSDGELRYKYSRSQGYGDKTAAHNTTNAHPSKLSRAQTEALTVRINTHSTRMVFTSRSPQWNTACSVFMMGIIDEIAPLIVGREKGNQFLKEMLAFNINLGEAASSQVESIQNRMSLQLEVLYNIVAQMDNQLSAELAVSAGRDSTSMKILAFISALFLPGSFIAAIFSMSMFDWQTHGGVDANGVVSRNFWVYWAVAIPLTLSTVIGWAAWWHYELRSFNSKVKLVRGEDERARATERPVYDLESTKGQ